MFLEEFLPDNLRETKAREFEMLKQSMGMSVIEYDAMFNNLAKYAPHLAVINNMKAKRFANGLKDYLFKVVPIPRTSTYAALRYEVWAKERLSSRFHSSRR